MYMYIFLKFTLGQLFYTNGSNVSQAFYPQRHYQIQSNSYYLKHTCRIQHLTDYNKLTGKKLDDNCN